MLVLVLYLVEWSISCRLAALDRRLRTGSGVRECRTVVWGTDWYCVARSQHWRFCLHRRATFCVQHLPTCTCSLQRLQCVNNYVNITTIGCQQIYINLRHIWFNQVTSPTHYIERGILLLWSTLLVSIRILIIRELETCLWRFYQETFYMSCKY